MCLMQSYILLSSHQVSTAVFQYKHCQQKHDPSGHMQFILGKDSAIEMRSSYPHYRHSLSTVLMFPSSMIRVNKIWSSFHT